MGMLLIFYLNFLHRTAGAQRAACWTMNQEVDGLILQAAGVELKESSRSGEV